jgi:YD repeat-containing protein
MPKNGTSAPPERRGLCTSVGYNSDNQLTTVGGASLAYDAVGNLMQDNSSAPAHSYQWDGEGRVTSVDSGSTWSFTYNAVGDRVQWVSPGGTYEHMFDPKGAWLGIYCLLDILPWGGGRVPGTPGPTPTSAASIT